MTSRGSFSACFNQDLPRRERCSTAILFYQGESLLAYLPVIESSVIPALLKRGLGFQPPYADTDIKDLLTAYLVLCPNVK